MKFPAFLFTLLFCAVQLFAAAQQSTNLPIRDWTVDGVQRQAIVYVPDSAKTKPAPVLFVFHGHGGTMQLFASRMKFEKSWPEAIVVYPQGLNTPGRLTDPEGKKSGWVMRFDSQNRDLRFFDAMLASLRKDYRVDEARIYVTGHSNGGSFTYLLLAMRGDLFAAFAPSSATARFLAETKLKPTPKPIFHLAGEKDNLVKFEWQRQTMESLRKINKCGPGVPWEHKFGTFYASEVDAPIVTYIHPGGHGMPADIGPIIQKFLQAYTNPQKTK